MRDLIFFVIFLPLPLLSFFQPWIGVLVWGWLALMNPHRQLWGFASGLSYNNWIAIATIVGFIMMMRKNRLCFDLTMALLISLIFCVSLSTAFSLAPEIAWPKGEELIKLVVFALMARLMLDRKVRIHAFVWLLAICLGFYGIKGGVLFILSAGNHPFSGPGRTFIGDRNHLAVAMLMVIPLMNYLRLHTADRLLRLGLGAAMVFTTLAIIGTSSRGGFIGLLAMGGFLWLRSRSKVMTAVALMPVVIGLTFVVPERWVERVQTIETAAEDDNSFKGRLNAWQTHVYAAVDRPILGAGPYALNAKAVFERYQPYEGIVEGVMERGGRAAHSIYFQVIGELGFLAFALYMTLAATAWFNAQRVISRTKNNAQLLWAHDLARMLQVSLIAFFVAGAGVSMAFYDFYLALTVTAAALGTLVDDKLPAATTRRLPTGGPAAKQS